MGVLVATTRQQRARQTNSNVGRFEVADADHYPLSRAWDCCSSTNGFVQATFGSRPMHPAIAPAMTEPADLRTPLPGGFGSQASQDRTESGYPVGHRLKRS
jgi:hypothetical protein